MKSTLNKFGTTVIALVMLWSCEKDDGPKSFANQPPVIYDQSFHVPEAITGGQTVAEVKAYDSNMGTKLTYNIAADDSDMFEISPKTGFLSIKAGKELDLEAPQFHKITVEVSDGVRQDTGQITICDCVPVFAQEAYEFEVLENILTDEVIHTFEVKDADSDLEDLTFKVFTNDDGLFEINQKGELSLASGKNLNFENEQEHNIGVSVEDNVDTVEVAVKIKVLDVEEAEEDAEAPFVTTWKTDIDGETIYIGLNSKYDYDFTIDWGDGTVEDISLTNPHYIEHVYETAGSHTVSIVGDFPAIYVPSIQAWAIDVEPAPKVGYGLVGIEQWGDIQWQTMNNAFQVASTLEFYNATDVPDLSQVTNMGYMFSGASLFNGDISAWDVSNVTTIDGMFSNATSFNRDLGSWDVSNVTTMTAMFEEATFFNGDISGWDVSHVTKMNSMFKDAASFNGDIGSWDVGHVNSMTHMFYGATSFDRDLGNWNIGKVEYMGVMLVDSGMSKENFNALLMGWSNFVEQNNGPYGINFGADGLTFCGTEALEAGLKLENDYNWNFTGDQFFEEECN